MIFVVDEGTFFCGEESVEETTGAGFSDTGTTSQQSSNPNTDGKGFGG